ncbi:MAG: hypothetical protein WEA76_11670 [Acidimicrobiia bacterium]
MTTVPPSSVETSVRLLVAGAGLLVIDTALTFYEIVTDRAIRIPRFDWYVLTPGVAIVVIAGWVIGLALFVNPRTRVRWGWVAPLGTVLVALADRQTWAGSVLYLIAVWTALHWWSARLAVDPRSAADRAIPLRVVQVHLAGVLLWAAYAKLNGRFLSGSVLSVSFTGMVELPEEWITPRVLRPVAVATITAEVAIAAGLWTRSMRRVAVALGLLFHVVIFLFLSPPLVLAGFGLVMASGYVLFIDRIPGAPHHG